MANVEHETWMTEALVAAEEAAARGDVPVGCVIVASTNEELARAGNAREASKDPTGHAELLALREAALKVGGWRLEGATVYVTLEPCAMCAGALVLARVERVVFGCRDPKAGAIVSLFGVGIDGRLNHRFKVVEGVLGERCAKQLRDFFAAVRAR